MRKTLLAATIAIMAGPALASPCEIQTSHQETMQGIPTHLLTAIARVESGAWDPESRAVRAWPWTVTSSEGDVKYATKLEAIRAVRALRSRGVTNIDVGCMQINLKHHPDAFSNLALAFDPALNVAYGARLLKRHFRVSGDWRMAAALYHSSNPRIYGPYQIKVENAWQQARENSGLAWYTNDINEPRTYARNWVRVTPRAWTGYHYRAPRGIAVAPAYRYDPGRPWTPDREPGWSTGQSWHGYRGSGRFN